jgi:hypothetical protein
MFLRLSQVFLCRDFVDFRKSINGLSQIVKENLELSSMSGALFVFCNKAKDKLNILYWGKAGFALWYKRLEKLLLEMSIKFAHFEEMFRVAQNKQFGKSSEVCFNAKYRPLRFSCWSSKHLCN